MMIGAGLAASPVAGGVAASSMSKSDQYDTAPIARPYAAPQRGRGPHPLAALMTLFAEVCGDDRARLDRALAGVRAYQAHPYRRAVEPAPAVAAVGSVTLRDYGGDGPAVVVVP